MKKPPILLSLVTILAGCGGRTPAPITAKLMEEIECQDAAAQVLQKDFWDAALDSTVLAAADTAMTFRVPTRGITDQRSSGRCWYYSTTNILRAELFAQEEADDWGDFQFSQAFGQFYDLLEKSNRFLENVVEYRREPIDSRMNNWLFRKPFGDGGHFSNAAHLIDKYGLVPQEAMPETHSSGYNLTLMNGIRTLMRKYGLQLRECPAAEIPQVKARALRDVYKLLALSIGTPPEKFEWQGVTYTPLSFRDRFVHHDMERDYINLMNDPTLHYGKVYEVRDSRNCVEYAPWRFLNVPMGVINAAGVASLRAGRMFYISADTGKEGLPDEGVYDTRLFRPDSLSGIDFSMSKADMLRSGEMTSLHAIAVAGVRLAGCNAQKGGCGAQQGECSGRQGDCDEQARGCHARQGDCSERQSGCGAQQGECNARPCECTPRMWLIENSFGTARGWDGFVVMSADWWDCYLLRAVFERRFLPEDILAAYDAGPIHELPSWNICY